MRHPRSRLFASADRSDASFTLAPPEPDVPIFGIRLSDWLHREAHKLLQTLAGGALADGTHALHPEAADKAGNISRLDLSFILDMTAATMSGRLAHDTGASG